MYPYPGLGGDIGVGGYQRVPLNRIVLLEGPNPDLRVSIGSWLLHLFTVNEVVLVPDNLIVILKLHE